MTPQHLLPDNPLEFIQRCVKERKLRWTYHVNMRLKERFISRQSLLASVAHYEIIASYPEDKYLPSFLVYSQHQGSVFHVLFAVDIERDNVRVITAYRPNPEEWDADLKTRRRSL